MALAAQGVSLLTDPIRVEDIGDRQIAHLGILWALDKFDSSYFPLLRRATEELRKLYSVKAEWLIDEGQDEEGNLRRRVEHNYTQINREPVVNGERMKALTKILADIEHDLATGRRHLDVSDSFPFSTAGGSLEFLGRLPRQDDHFELGILRDLTLIQEGKREEFIIEWSLQTTSQE